MGNNLLRLKNLEDVFDRFVSWITIEDERIILYGFLMIIPIFESACRVYVLSRQFILCAKTKLPMPEDLKEAMSPIDFENYRKIYMDKYYDNILEIVISSVYNILLFSSKIIHNVFWVRAVMLTEFLGFNSENETIVSMVFVSLVILAITIPVMVLNLVFGEFLEALETLVDTIILHVVCLPVAAITIVIFSRVTSKTWMLIPLSSLTFAFFQYIFYPLVYFPYFSLYEYLGENYLRTSIEKVASIAGFPLKEIFVKMEITHTEPSHVYIHAAPCIYSIILHEKIFYKVDNQGNGHGFKDREIVALVAHELGHWRSAYWPKNFIITQIKVIAFSILVNYFYQLIPTYTSIGFVDQEPVLIGIYLTKVIVQPIYSLVQIFTNFINRRDEFLADHFVVKCGYKLDLKKALIKRDKFDYFPLFDTAFSCYFLSEPSVMERFRNMKSYVTLVEDGRLSSIRII